MRKQREKERSRERYRQRARETETIRKQRERESSIFMLLNWFIVLRFLLTLFMKDARDFLWILISHNISLDS